ncbi:MAG: nucleotidyltransferase domain-containing protein [Burkholderiales bacterium]
MTDAELLLREPQGNQIRYRANRASPIFPELAGIFRKTAGLADVLRDAFAPIVKSIELAFVFGSVAKGEESAASDVDIFVLGNAKYQDVVTATAPLRERLGRNVNPVVMTRKQFASLCKARDRFIQRVSSEPKIFIFGAEDDLG